MELCIKTLLDECKLYQVLGVSILVLMELCIKTPIVERRELISADSFNPCFNGTMYKN